MFTVSLFGGSLSTSHVNNLDMHMCSKLKSQKEALYYCTTRCMYLAKYGISVVNERVKSLEEKHS